jgi:hypothetical protein
MTLSKNYCSSISAPLFRRMDEDMGSVDYQQQDRARPRLRRYIVPVIISLLFSTILIVWVTSYRYDILWFYRRTSRWTTVEGSVASRSGALLYFSSKEHPVKEPPPPPPEDRSISGYEIKRSSSGAARDFVISLESRYGRTLSRYRLGALGLWIIRYSGWDDDITRTVPPPPGPRGNWVKATFLALPYWPLGVLMAMATGVAWARFLRHSALTTRPCGRR